MTLTVWVLAVPEYDNYGFALYRSREGALAALRAQVGNETGEWVETYGGEQIEFRPHTPVRKIKRGLTRYWSLTEQEVNP